MEIISAILFALFCTYYSINIILMVSAIWSIKNQLCEDVPLSMGDLPHITIIVPAYNEKCTIVGTVKTILKQKYPKFSMVVVNDGSSDCTLDTLVLEFGLELTPAVHKDYLLTKAIRGSYSSKALSRLLVLDKENGGKSDAINAGLNVSTESSYVCVIDADVILEQNALFHAVQAILNGSGGCVVAAGGNIRIGCGSEVSDGAVTRLSTPGSLIHLLQILEYLRSFSLFRLGWNSLNAVPILSGAFGVFKRDVVMHLGGYQKFSKGEDMEITLRLHEYNLKGGSPYRIVQLVKPLCFTGAPSTLQELAGQRRRWQVGLLSCLKVYSHLLFRPRFGALGMVALPYLLVFEAISPFLEIAGYVLIGVNFFVLHQSPEVFLWFVMVVIGGALFVNIATVLTEAFILQLYKGFFDLFKLLLVGMIEPFGYHQLNQLWKIQATFGFFKNIQLKSTWQPPKRD
jgi:cellulose synthase/poly-beta-1,6-N-acetylglucosamine synthase-like glycosyltransferase